MTQRRRAIIGILALVVCGVLVAYFWPEKPEPVYKGIKLSEWVVIGVGNNRGDLGEKIHAIKAIGTNGIPFYQEWIQNNPGLLRQGYLRLAKQGRKFLHLKSLTQDERSTRAVGALTALAVIGEQAEAVIPQLVSCVTKASLLDSSQRSKASFAMQILIDMGNSGILAYMDLMTNANPRVRAMAIDQSTSFFRSTHIVGLVQTSLRDPDPLVRSAATNAMRQMVRAQDAQ